MKKRFLTKIKRRKKIPYFSSFLCIIILFVFLILNNSSLKITNTKLLSIILSNSKFSSTNSSVPISLKNKAKDLYINPSSYLLLNQNLVKEVILPTQKEEHPPPKKEPLIYLYNSHQTEEYAASSFLEYTIKPTVMISNYIMQEKFTSANYPTIVEERSIKEILNNNSWAYSYSYKASRIYLEDIKKTNPTLKYFIDIHRDSLPKDRTTITINDKNYARILLLIGLENQNYEANLKFSETLHQKLNEKYPNISKGIYKKSGPGVNGIYNQDFSPYTILVEMGGYENTTTEVMNSSLAFADVFLEVISSYESN